MNWIEEADWKCRHKRQILFAKDSEFLQDVALLLHHQEHRAAVLWAFDFAAESVCWLEKRYPGEERPGRALQAARDWAAGTVKMPLAQRAILDCHALAKEISDRADQAVCPAVGQACALVHTAGHAMGYPLYDLTSILFRLGMEDGVKAVEARKQEYIDRLLYWGAHVGEYQGTWADFMLR